MRIGALTIGHSPRDDMQSLLREAYPGHQIIEAGALDVVSDIDLLPCGMTDPTDVLTTRLCDGSFATFDRTFLLPLLQDALHRLEDAGVDATILLSVGDFPRLSSRKPLIKPFEHAYRTLRSRRARHIAVIVPVPEQEDTSRLKWAAYGFDASVWVKPPGYSPDYTGMWLHERAINSRAIDAVIVDDVGYCGSDVLTMQGQCNVPMIDLGQLALSQLNQLFAQ